MSDPRLELLLLALEPRPGSRFWHGGPTLLGALRGVSAEDAVWRPGPKRRSIWDHALHGAYWKYAVRRQLMSVIDPAAVKGMGFPRSPANWPRTPQPAGEHTAIGVSARSNIAADEKSWKADRALLADEHARLIDAVRRFPLDHLFKKPPTAKQWTAAELIIGAAEHDTYHTAQIQLVKRLRRAAR